MKGITRLLIFMMYFFLFLYLTLVMIKIIFFVGDVGNVLGYLREKTFSNTLLLAFVITYIVLLIDSYNGLNKKSGMEEHEVMFWKRIMLVKPLSGITVYNYIVNDKVKIATLRGIIKLVFNLRNLSFCVAILSLIAIFLIKKPSDIFLFAFIVCLYLSIIMALIVEPLIIIDAHSKEEFTGLKFFLYFSQYGSFGGYGDYYKKYVSHQLGKTGTAPINR